MTINRPHTKFLKTKTVHDIDLFRKTVLVRVDFNVPFKPGTSEVSDDSRIIASLPTIELLVKNECRVLICAHLGRPEGEVVENLRMTPVSKRLCYLLNKKVTQVPDCIGPQVGKAIQELEPGGVIMLENLRFHPGEEANDKEFAHALANQADIYINDAFGAAHRAHASIDMVTRFLPAFSGLLMNREITHLTGLFDSPVSPYVVLLGGKKLSDKLSVLRTLSLKADTIIVGGGMVIPFLEARGYQIDNRFLTNQEREETTEIIQEINKQKINLLVPTDLIVAKHFSASAQYMRVPVDSIPPSWFVMDIGPSTSKMYAETLKSAKTVVWNGTMGVAEWSPFSAGTTSIANSLADLRDATTLVGGGSTAEAVGKLGLTDKMTHVSTGGGASLELLEGKLLPGVAALLEDESQE